MEMLSLKSVVLSCAIPCASIALLFGGTPRATPVGQSLRFRIFSKRLSTLALRLVFVCLFSTFAVAENNAPEVVRYQVLDTSGSRADADFGAGTTIALADFPSFDIAATISPTPVASVQFAIAGGELPGTRSSVDNTAPYTVGADSDGDSQALTLSAGDYLLATRIFSGPDATGDLLALTTIEFSVDDTPTAATDIEAEAETEAETEVEVAIGVDVAAGATVSGASAAASGNNAIAQTATSGSLSLKTNPGTTTGDRRSGSRGASRLSEGDATRTIGELRRATNQRAITSVISAGAEAEAALESEVEAQTGVGVAAAAGGTAASASAVGNSVILNRRGRFRPVAGDNDSTVLAGTSTSTSLSANLLSDSNVSGRSYDTGTSNLPGHTVSEVNPKGYKSGPARLPGFRRRDRRQSNRNAKGKFILQVDTEVEVEAEAEGEARASASPGAAAAAATGGSVAAVAGDFARADGALSLATSTSTTEVTRPLPAIFFAPVQTARRRQKQDFVGKGLFESEAESEAKAKARTAVNNNSASVAVAAAGGGGSAGLGATSRAAASTSASTSTESNLGQQVRRNDLVSSGEDRFRGRTQFVGDEAESEAKSSAGVNVDISGSQPQTGVFVGNVAEGDARSTANTVIEGTSSTRSGQEVITGTVKLDERRTFEGGVSAAQCRKKKNRKKRACRKNRKPKTSGSVLAGPSNLEVEVESEVEVEAEAEVGFNAAAAGASAVAVQAENGLIQTPAEAATATSASTSVYDNGENHFEHVDQPGPARRGLRAGVAVPDLNPDDLSIEVETEAEAEAEVGNLAAAAAAAAASSGSDAIKADSQIGATPFAAASAAGAGAEVTVEIFLPNESDAGIVVALARASDPECRGVAVAVAVAGVPTVDGLVNEVEKEAEGLCEAEVEVFVFTNPADASIPVLLTPGNTPPSEEESEEPESPDSTLESESEAEAEAEAEAGYGVAAAAASAGSAGIGSDASAKSVTVTRLYQGGYSF